MTDSMRNGDKMCVVGIGVHTFRILPCTLHAMYNSRYRTVQSNCQGTMIDGVHYLSANAKLNILKTKQILKYCGGNGEKAK